MYPLGIFLVYLSLVPYSTTADIFTSISAVNHIANLDKEIFELLSLHKQRVVQLLHSLENYLSDHENDISAKGSDDSTKISENPLMVLMLLRRFAQDLSDISVNLLTLSILNADLDRLINSANTPSIEDLNGAANGIRQLQFTYQLPTHELAQGIIRGKKTNVKLTAFDMELIGQQYIVDRRYADALQWLYYAYQSTLNGDKTISQDVIIKKLTETRALHNSEFLKIHPAPSANLFSGLVSSNFGNIPELGVSRPRADHRLKVTENNYHDMSNFNALCRGEELLSAIDRRSLRCWFSKEFSKYHWLNPLKVELHHENPPIFQIHEVLSENTVNHIKNVSLPVLVRAGVVTTDGFVASYVRTSTTVFLHDYDAGDRILNQFPSLVHRLTGLETGTPYAAEELQVSCYGPTGGYYYPHFDALQQKDDVDAYMDDPTGDRISTVMFYLSDVELGGATAFPRLGIAVKPSKGSAVVWNNLLLNGRMDKLTLHGGCPVLLGSKWESDLLKL